MKKEYQYQIGDEIKTVIIEPDGDQFRVEIDDKAYKVAVRIVEQKFTLTMLSGQPPGLSAIKKLNAVEPRSLNLTVNGQQYRAYVASHESHTYVSLAGNAWKLERPQPQRRHKGAGADAISGQLEATMPSQVLDILVAEGDEVERGQTLLLLEAMKMESRITAPFAGQVGQIHCQTGQVVERGQHLLDLTPHD